MSLTLAKTLNRTPSPKPQPDACGLTLPNPKTASPRQTQTKPNDLSQEKSMIVVMEQGASDAQIQHVAALIR